MLWPQAIVCFCAWVGYGVWLSRSRVARRFFAAKPQGLLAGPALFVIGMVVLVGAMWLVYASGGLTPQGLAPWALALILVAGTVFVHAQCVGAVMILRHATQPETRPPTETSVREGTLHED